MKLRRGFVSNSSSSSFIIGNSDIGSIAKYMLDVVIKDWTKGKISDEHKQWKNNLKIALKRQDILDGKIGITMPSCNYETYIFIKNDRIYISTSHNHEWKLDNVTRSGDGSDGGDSDAVHGIIGELNYFNVRNRLIHSKAEYTDWNGGDTKHKTCPNCKTHYAQYVVYMGKNLCADCFKGIIGTDEIIEPIPEKYVDVEKKYQDAMSKLLKNMNAVKFLEP
jgi:hypothetical protein